MSKKFWLVVVSVLAIGVLTGCHSKFQYNDSLVAQEDIIVVEDYDNWQLPKCTINKGDAVTITGFSSLKQGGGSETQPLIELSSSGCTGWAFDDPSLNDKLK